jgi:hypothetical protein
MKTFLREYWSKERSGYYPKENLYYIHDAQLETVKNSILRKYEDHHIGGMSISLKEELLS